jgi:cation transport ATPase
MEAMAKQTQAELNRTENNNKDRWLNITIVAGAIIIFVFGYGLHLFQYLGIKTNLQHWESWELGALLWTVLFILYYFATLKLVNKNKTDKVIIVFLFLVFILTGSAWASLLYWHSWHNQFSVYIHVFSVTGIGTFLMLIDRLVSKYHHNAQDKKAFRESFLLAGVPTVIAYAALDLYLITDGLVWHRWILHTPPENQEVFLSGAISFQLLVSNVIFVLIQKGTIHKVTAPRKKKVLVKT